MVDWDLIGFVVASNYRRKVVEELSKGVKTPKQISKATKIRINHVSNLLSDLSAKELLECKNPNAKVGRLYELTDKGNKLSEALSKLGKE